MTERNPNPDPRSPAPDDTPFDAANESLANALKASFRVLRAVMFLLVIVFLGSGVKIIDNSEQAVVLRFGALLPKVRGPGLSVAFPYPIDETLVVPTLERNTLHIRSHWFHVRGEHELLSLSELAREHGEGLHPMRDGALLTADRGLVHVQWTLIYRIEDLEKYVGNVADGVVGDVETLITCILENAAVRHAATFTAEEITRTRTAALALAVKRDINEKLGPGGLDTGIVVESLEPETTVPLQTLQAFANVTRAENKKDTAVREAEKVANAILNRTAGEAHSRLIERLDELDMAKASGDVDRLKELEVGIERMLEEEVAGTAGSLISGAKSFYTEVVQGIEGDVEEYESVLEEYRQRPDLLVNRLWEETRQRLLRLRGVRKHFIPPYVKEVRIIVHPDPREKEIDELEALRKEAEGLDEAEMGTMVPVEDFRRAP